MVVVAYVVVGNQDRLVWGFRVVADEPVFCEVPGSGIEALRAWVDAVVAVARDLDCLRYGREAELDGLEWELGPRRRVLADARLEDGEGYRRVHGG